MGDDRDPDGRPKAGIESETVASGSWLSRLQMPQARRFCAANSSLGEFAASSAAVVSAPGKELRSHRRAGKRLFSAPACGKHLS